VHKFRGRFRWSRSVTNGRQGATVDGPALVEEAESTCVIEPGDRAHVDATGHLVIDIGALATASVASAVTQDA